MAVLDAATGTGLVARLVAERVGPAGHVLGVDTSQVMLQQARAKAAGSNLSNIEFRQADATRLDLAPASFDVVFCCEAIMLFEDPVQVLRDWNRLLKPSGLLAFTSASEACGAAPLLKHAWEEVLGPPAPVHIHEPLGSSERIEAVLSSAGFETVDIQAEVTGRYRPIDKWNCTRDWLLLMLKGNEAVERLTGEQVHRLCEAWRKEAEGYWEDLSHFFVYARKSPPKRAYPTRPVLS
jgi:SAM-dependent methyltransferase